MRLDKQNSRFVLHKKCDNKVAKKLILRFGKYYENPLYYPYKKLQYFLMAFSNFQLKFFPSQTGEMLWLLKSVSFCPGGAGRYRAELELLLSSVKPLACSSLEVSSWMTFWTEGRPPPKKMYLVLRSVPTGNCPSVPILICINHRLNFL